MLPRLLTIRIFSFSVLAMLSFLPVAAQDSYEMGEDTIYIGAKAKMKDEDKLPGKVYINVDHNPGKGQNISSLVRKAVKFPSKAKKEDVQGNVVYVRYLVDTDGKVSEASVLTSASPSLDEEALRVVNSLPRLTPALKHGKPVPVYMTIPVSFPKIKRPGDVLSKTGHWMPEYKGGDKALIKYIQDNLKYPEAAARNKIEGLVVLRFVVSPEGKVTELKIVKNAHYEMDKEALRVVSSMEDWIPAISGGRRISVFYTLPVNFKLKKDNRTTRVYP